MSVENSPKEQGNAEILSGKDIFLPISSMPQKVFETLKKVEDLGFEFELHRLSGVSLNRDSIVEGWNLKPENSYWELIDKEEISGNAATLPNGWILIENFKLPNVGSVKDYSGGNLTEYFKNDREFSEKDALGELLAKLRESGRIPKVKDISKSSRLAISYNNIVNDILIETVQFIGLDKTVGAIRVSTKIEENIIGNFKHPEWNKTNVSQWHSDVCNGAHSSLPNKDHPDKIYNGYSLLGGSLNGEDGLRRASKDLPKNAFGNVSFRLVIDFSQNPQA